MSSDKQAKEVEPAKRQALLAAVWYTCSKIVEEEEVELGVIASEQFVAALSELVYAQAESLAIDLEAFANHAGRSAITKADIQLACRRNPQLLAKLEEVVAPMTNGKPSKVLKK